MFYILMLVIAFILLRPSVLEPYYNSLVSHFGSLYGNLQGITTGGNVPRESPFSILTNTLKYEEV